MKTNYFRLTNDMRASKGQRFANYIIDLFAVYGLFFLFAFVWGFVRVAMGDSAEAFGTDEQYKFTLLFILLYFIYYTAFESYGGRTIGKMITGTMVVTNEGEKPEAANIAGRTLCRLIPFDNFSFLGERGWHDSISKTDVVKKHIYLSRRNEVIEMDEIGEKSEII
ncbi:RDD family protein [Flavobacterium selenitireducens]|uniref:RDD family protein n=1 Tax=Flavobacterium selenitireducens TaxID=2722704 RepID=UPI00168B592C|nr:RDD family protein [Flavobacterium selenitireducens]MBD3582329.1 RDD family protein [Flavobacterium selenitireducens]